MAERYFYQSKPHDHYITPKWAFEILEPFIEDYNIVYEPFYNKSAYSADVFRDMGKTVIWNDEDFFEHYEERIEQCEIIISNPPYTKYKEILEVLSKKNKPVILLMPIAKLTTKTIKNLYKEGYEYKLIIPPKRIQYIKTDEDGNIEPEQANKCSFDSVFFTYNLNLPYDINYL